MRKTAFFTGFFLCLIGASHFISQLLRVDPSMMNTFVLPFLAVGTGVLLIRAATKTPGTVVNYATKTDLDGTDLWYLVVKDERGLSAVPLGRDIHYDCPIGCSHPSRNRSEPFVRH
jgi:hypothetical protein